MFTLIFRLNHPFHSCEGRNLYAEGGNCTISRRFAAAEIPTFAGMGRSLSLAFAETGRSLSFDFAGTTARKTANLFRRVFVRVHFAAEGGRIDAAAEIVAHLLPLEYDRVADDVGVVFFVHIG
ncbi:MAG: hypothetical protein ACR2QC_02275, partial [Gammaproteobacteria bacterium]